ncbi:MAG: hypothetical protein LW625_02770 [Planctomycetaceae bacterium]|nr:hypothetical protein [Planctomycetaceae bacterium]
MRVNGAWHLKVGPWSPNQIRAIADAVNKVNDAAPQPNGGASTGPTVFLARITGSTPVSGKTAVYGGNPSARPVAWTYDWEEVSLNTSDAYETAKAYRRTSTLAGTKGKAFNGCEGVQMIGATTTLGPGITTANIPSGFTFKQIATNTVVLMYALSRDNGEPCFFFSVPNAVDGTCTSSLTGETGGGEGEIGFP